MKESKLEKNCRDLAEAMMWAVYKGFGRIGASDKILLKDGRGFTAEIKTDVGIESELQKNDAQYLKLRGVPRYVIRNLEDMKNALLTEQYKLDNNGK